MEMFSKSNRYNLCDNNTNVERRVDEKGSYGVSVWKKRNALFIKIVSVVLSAVFLHQQVGWAENGRPVWAQSKPMNQVGQPLGPIRNNFEIPYDLASIEEVQVNDGNESIIHIQDAHASLSAQYSIADLLDKLVTNYDLSFIALEGASGYIDTSILKTFTFL